MSTRCSVLVGIVLTHQKTAPDERCTQLLNIVQTRAGKKKSQAQEQDDEKATKESQAVITSWNSIQLEPLSSEDPSPLNVKESEVKEYGPDRAEFKKA